MDSQTLGGEEISGETLTLGRRVYQRHCLVCHGERGDGRGSSAGTMYPSPRDFRLARFKFAGIEDRGLPHDEELARIIRGGLTGSAMPPWDSLSEKELAAVIAYIKSFSLAGQGFRSKRLTVKQPTIPEEPAPDLAKGEKLYHSYFECAKCHPSYVKRETIASWDAQQREDAPYLPAPKWSPNYRDVLVPPDFLRHDMRSVATVGDVYRVIAYGLQGPMPGYGHLGAENVWAVAHYVWKLASMRGTKEGQALQDKMREWAGGN